MTTHILDRIIAKLGTGAVPATACALKISCPVCHGHGVTMDAVGALAVGHVCPCVAKCPECFGSARTFADGFATSCHDPNPNLIAQFLTGAQIPARYVNAQFGDFKNYSGNGQAVTTHLQNWVDQFSPKQKKGLLITGPVGVGKTYLLCAMAKRLAMAGHSVRFTDFFQLLGLLRAAYSDGRGDPEILNPLHNVDVLLIDELGKGRNSDWELSVADSLISERYNAGKVVIASTNYTLVEARHESYVHRDLDGEQASHATDFNPLHFGSLEARIGKRIFSRLAEMTTFLELTGKDFRKP